MIDAVRAYVDREGLFVDHQRILIAVSGGADSVCLARLLVDLASEWGISCGIAHVHHGLRGDDADADAAFVAGLGDELGVPVFVRHYQTESYAQEHMISIEMAARELRHRAFSEMALEFEADAIALGHHLSDQAETVLFRLVWGTSPLGIGGMKSMKRVKDLILIRPLLEVTRKEIIRYLKSQGQGWREDESNEADGYMRNRIRHEILPAIAERINPCAEEAMVRFGSMIGEDAQYLQSIADELYDKVEENPGELNVETLLSAPVALQRRVVYQWIRHCGLGRFATFLVVERLLELCRSCDGSKQFEVNHITFVRAYNVLRVASAYPAEPFSEHLNLGGAVTIKSLGLRVVSQILDQPFVLTGQQVGRFPASANLNPERLGGQPLVIRSWLQGDRFEPLGMDGHKKIKDVLIDAKVPRDLRSKIPLLEVEGQIVWVPGYQIARGWEVVDFNSPALHIEIDNAL